MRKSLEVGKADGLSNDIDTTQREDIGARLASVSRQLAEHGVVQRCVIWGSGLVGISAQLEKAGCL